MYKRQVLLHLLHKNIIIYLYENRHFITYIVGKYIVDVYKRQLLSFHHLFFIVSVVLKYNDCLITILPSSKSRQALIRDIYAAHCVPVSYTHLDVYKRQVVDRKEDISQDNIQG